MCKALKKHTHLPGELRQQPPDAIAWWSTSCVEGGHRRLASSGRLPESGHRSQQSSAQTSGIWTTVPVK